jgi:uncharacterized membrane protein YbaN (DUF454 family)
MIERGDQARAGPKGADTISRVLPRGLAAFLFPLGCLCTVIGIVGLILPGLPGTIFLIGAAWCFSRSSPRFEAWLLGHRRLGPPVRQWRESGSIPRRVKALASVSLAVSWALIAASDISPYVKAGLALLFLAIAGFIVTRPEGGAA